MKKYREITRISFVIDIPWNQSNFHLCQGLNRRQEYVNSGKCDRTRNEVFLCILRERYFGHAWPGLLCAACPQYIRPNAGLMLGQRLRRCPNISPASVVVLRVSGRVFFHQKHFGTWRGSLAHRCCVQTPGVEVNSASRTPIMEPRGGSPNWLLKSPLKSPLKP